MAVPLLTFYAPAVACLYLAVVYPTYKSLQAIESLEPEAVQQWLAYWIIFAAMTVVESIIGGLLYWIPIYYIGKTVVVLWLVAPHTEGANYLYKHKLKPLLSTLGRGLLKSTSGGSGRLADLQGLSGKKVA